MSFNHYHQSVEEIINSANPVQRIIWNDLFLRFGENISVSQFAYNGPGTPASIGELSVYSANKLYFIYQLTAYAVTTESLVNTGIQLSNFAGVMNGLHVKLTAWWDATAALTRYRVQTLSLENVAFGHMTTSINYVHFQVYGFRIGR